MAWLIPNGTDVPQVAGYGFGAMGTPSMADFAIVDAASVGFRIVSGCQLVPGTTTGTVKVNAGVAMFGGMPIAIAAQDNKACVSLADATNPLWIEYELDNTGTLQANVGVVSSTPLATGPIPPSPIAGRTAVGWAFVTSTAFNTGGAVDASYVTNNGNAKIIDKRFMPNARTVYQLLQPVYSAPTDGVTYAISGLSVNASSNGLNLNTLLGAGGNNLVLNSATGLPSTNGVVVLTHAATDYIITYASISGATLQTCTAYSAQGNTPGSVTIATNDAVANTKIVTTATGAFLSTQIGSFITGSAQFPTASSTLNINGVGPVPGGAGATWAYLTGATLGAGTGITLGYAVISGGLTPPAGATIVDFISVGPGGGGASGTNVAANTSDANGGGGGGPGGMRRDTYSVADLMANVLTNTINYSLNQGGRGGLGTTSAATNGQNGTGISLSNGFSIIIPLAGGGFGAVGTTGGNSGAGGLKAGTYTGGNGAIGSSSTAATAGWDSKANNMVVPGGGGGGGGLHGSGSVLIASALGGGGGNFGFLFNGMNGGSAGGAGVAGGNAGSYTGTLTTSVVPGGGGGGGGGRNTTANGGKGGDGGKFGGGGGGGGNSVGGTAPNGGNGGDGALLVIWHCA